jgi:hypothetical protein
MYSVYLVLWASGDFFTGPEAQPAELSKEEKREEEEEIAELRAKL